MLGLITGVMLTAAATVAAPAQWCCRIVGMNAKAGVVLARNDANGKTFLFAPGDRNLFAALKAGTRVNFQRRSGISVQGFPGSSFKPLKWRSSGRGAVLSKRGKDIKVEIDCSITPEFCPGYKPGLDKVTMIGTTTWQDVMDYCADEMFSGNCISGPNESGPP